LNNLCSYIVTCRLITVIRLDRYNILIGSCLETLALEVGIWWLTQMRGVMACD
jgi:hypothetical protein